MEGRAFQSDNPILPTHTECWHHSMPMNNTRNLRPLWWPSRFYKGHLGNRIPQYKISHFSIHVAFSIYALIHVLLALLALLLLVFFFIAIVFIRSLEP